MSIPQVNLLAVLVAGVLIFMLGAVWYSAIFRKPWNSRPTCVLMRPLAWRRASRAGVSR